jgi:hypothetical protein
MDPEQPGGSHRIMILLLVAGGAAVLAYFLFFRNSSSAGGSTSGGGGTITSSGSTTLQTGAVQVSVTQNPDTSGQTTTNPQPTPPGKKPTTSQSISVPNVVGKTGQNAAAQLKKAGLAYAQSPVSTPKGKRTKVTSEEPAAGKKVAKGSTVHVKLSY